MYRDLFKELAHTTTWAAKSDIGRAGQQAGDPQKSYVELESEGI